jgi:hypothetical protein
LNEIAKEKTWVWTDKTSFKFNAWRSDQPGNHGSDEDCASIYKDRTWHDVNCAVEMASICKRAHFVYDDEQEDIVVKEFEAKEKAKQDKENEEKRIIELERIRKEKE